MNDYVNWSKHKRKYGIVLVILDLLFLIDAIIDVCSGTATRWDYAELVSTSVILCLLAVKAINEEIRIRKKLKQMQDGDQAAPESTTPRKVPLIVSILITVVLLVLSEIVIYYLAPRGDDTGLTIQIVSTILLIGIVGGVLYIRWKRDKN